SNGRGRLMAVLDGHGGARVASLAAGYLPLYFREAMVAVRGQVEQALERTVNSLNKLTGDFKMEGSTISIVYVPDDQSKAFMCMLGDSPIIFRSRYEYRPRFLYVHNVANIEEAKYVFERAWAVSIDRSYYFMPLKDFQFASGLNVTRCLGNCEMLPALRREPVTLAIDLDEQSFVLLCTDGCSKGYDVAEAQAMMKAIDAQADARQILLTKPVWNDNLTAILYRVSKPASLALLAGLVPLVCGWTLS
ncbi:MAG: hypothetical protein NT118_09485, partial [Lentisphaerae bacterium]|nr:hypothetical protein [Lentisphaerota bacterium]